MRNKNECRYNLRPLWDAILDIYNVFAKICENYDLRYCADTGTALGAVRHQGFIPWDDDLDIQMPRSDYEKFVKIANKELPDGLVWLDRFNCPSYENAFGKIIVTDITKVDAVALKSGLKLGQGIFIDIFPVDGYPDSWIARRWRNVQNHLLGFRAKFNDGWKCCTTGRAKIAWFFGAILYPINYKIRNYREQVDFFEKRAKQYAFGKTKMCVSIGCANYVDDKPYPFKLFGNLRKIKFDSVSMQVHEYVEEYLVWMFGDYMKLPPENARQPVHSSAANEKWRLGIQG